MITKMKQRIIFCFSGIFLLLFTSSPYALSQVVQSEFVEAVHQRYIVTDIRGSMISIDSIYDVNPDGKALALLQPYKREVDKHMTNQIGISAQTMQKADKINPEGLLSNLVADVLRGAGSKELGKPCDMGLMNSGGLRSIFPAGKITITNIYEILPFENTLSVLTLNGEQLTNLLKDVAHVGNKGVSGVRMVISRDGELLRATVGGKPIDNKKLYTLATINYLAEGNDGIKSLANTGIKRINCDSITLRDVFIKYVKAQTALGKKINSHLDGRITYDK
jgi:2',3'-cyclic-nucleotide 2'-phosphodiesterase (5'-nucleotidase family)